MKLSECLLNRDIQELEQLARSFAWQGNFRSKMELIQAVHVRLLHPETCRESILDMNEHQRNVWTVICFYPKRVYRKSELRRLARLLYPSLDYTDWQEWLFQFIQLGYLQPIRIDHEERWQLPEDVRSQLQNQLVAYWRSKLQLPASSPVENESTDSFDLDTLHDMFQFLCFIADEPAPLTVDGVIYKAVQRSLFKSFRLQECTLEATRWRFGYGRRFPYYPDRFSLIYDYCYHQGWIEEMDNTLVINPQVETFRYGDIVNRSRQADLIQFWMEQYQNAIPLLPMILAFCSHVTNGNITAKNHLKDMCRPWVRPFYYDDTDQIISRRIVQMGIFLGLFSWAGRNHTDYDKIKINKKCEINKL